SAEAELNVLWPVGSSPNGGVGNQVGWYGIHASPSRSPFQHGNFCPRHIIRDAVTGRTESYLRFIDHLAMPASNPALATRKNSFTSWSRLFRSRRETPCANCNQCPGGIGVPAPSE